MDNKVYSSGLITQQDATLARYLEEIKKFPVLAPEEEYILAKRYQETKDLDAAHQLVSSHLRLVAKIAMGYRGYGLPMIEVISEGNIGLMQAVRKFEPDKGFRLSTYAIWWIKAAIQEYVLRSWSMVKIGTTRNQKKLFYNLRKIKQNISAFENNQLNREQLKYVADSLDVSEAEVVEMNQRLLGDSSLNAPITTNNGEVVQWQDSLTDQTSNQEENLIEENDFSHKMAILEQALKNLSERDADIFRARRLHDPASTLEILANKYNISRERVRQIEVKSYETVQKYIRQYTSAQEKYSSH